MNELKNLIAGSYGTADDEFAGHPNDAERAREALLLAGKEKIGLAEFLNLHRQYLKGKGRSEEHIEEQLEEVQKISNYLDYD